MYARMYVTRMHVRQTGVVKLNQGSNKLSARIVRSGRLVLRLPGATGGQSVCIVN